MKHKYLILILLFLAFSFLSCNKLDDLFGRKFTVRGHIVNVCNQPMSNIPVVFAGCVGFSNDPSFVHHTTTDLNGYFEFKVKENCTPDRSYVNIEQGPSQFLKAYNYYIYYVNPRWFKVCTIYELQPGDDIVKVYFVDTKFSDVYPPIFSMFSDTLFCLTYVPREVKYKIKTEFMRNSILESRIDSGYYNCSEIEAILYINL